jgi:hypothetical protein
MRNVDLSGVGRGGHKRAGDARVGVTTDVGLEPVVLLLAFLRWVHLWVTGLLQFFAEDGAVVIVASTSVPLQITRPLSDRPRHCCCAMTIRSIFARPIGARPDPSPLG